MTHDEAVIELLRTERGYVAWEQLLRSLVSLSQYGGGDWPKATRREWEAVVLSLASRRRIASTPEGIKLPSVQIETRPEPQRRQAKKNDDQGMLF